MDISVMLILKNPVHLKLRFTEWVFALSKRNDANHGAQ